MAQNNDLMRQMQQQLAAQQGAMPQQHGAAGGFTVSQFPNINANMLMSAFQQSAQSGQNPLQGAESLLASVLAAANSNAQAQAQNQGGTGIVNAQQSTSQSASTGTMSQQGPFVGFQGLDQLQNLNPGTLPQGFQSSLNGLQGLQHQIMSLQQQLGTSGPMQHGQQQTQPDQSSLQSNAGTPFGHQQQPFAWMGQNFNQATFNPAALSLGALSGGGGGGGDQNSFQNQDFALANGGIANFGMGGMNPSAFQLQQQIQQASQQHQQQQIQQQQQQQLSGSQNKTRQSPSNTTGSSGHAKNSKLSSMLKEEQNATERSSGKGGGKKPSNVQDKKKRAKSFPEKLMQAMMENADEEAVAWLPDGKSFVIVNPDLFCNEVLNKIFKESKYASFVRKLHRYVFVIVHISEEVLVQVRATNEVLLFCHCFADGALFA